MLIVEFAHAWLPIDKALHIAAIRVDTVLICAPNEGYNHRLYVKVIDSSLCSMVLEWILNLQIERWFYILYKIYNENNKSNWTHYLLLFVRKLVKKNANVKTMAGGMILRILSNKFLACSGLAPPKKPNILIKYFSLLYFYWLGWLPRSQSCNTFIQKVQTI